MKRLTSLGILFFVTTFAFGQEKANVIEYFERRDQIGSFFSRWYWRLNGLSTTSSIETLQLTDDNKFFHSTSTTCLVSWEFGTWTKDKNVLTLKVDSANRNSLETDFTQYQFIIINKRLYQPGNLDKNQWVMKKNLKSTNSKVPITMPAP